MHFYTSLLKGLAPSSGVGSGLVSGAACPGGPVLSIPFTLWAAVRLLRAVIGAGRGCSCLCVMASSYLFILFGGRLLLAWHARRAGAAPLFSWHGRGPKGTVMQVRRQHAVAQPWENLAAQAAQARPASLWVRPSRSQGAAVGRPLAWLCG